MFNRILEIRSEHMLSMFALLSAGVATISFVLLIFRGQSGQNESGKRHRQTSVVLNQSGPAGLAQSKVFRFGWSLIHGFGLKLLPCMTWGYRDRLTLSIRRAGLHGWSCADMFSAQILLRCSS